MTMAVRGDAAVNAVRGADRLEQALQRARSFRTAEKQRATMLEREMQQRQHALLDLRLEINEQIAAGADIDVGERRVTQHILRSEHHHVADLFADPVYVLVPVKEPVEALE